MVLDDIVTIGNRFYELAGHYPKEQYQKGNICVRHVAGDKNLADLLTKAVTTQYTISCTQTTVVSQVAAVSVAWAAMAAIASVVLLFEQAALTPFRVACGWFGFVGGLNINSSMF